MSKNRWFLVRFLGIFFLGAIIALTGNYYIQDTTHQVIGALLYGIGLFLSLGGFFTLGFSKDFFRELKRSRRIKEFERRICWKKKLYIL